MAFGLSAGAAALVGAVAAPVVGGMISGDAAGDAARTQAGATDRANAMTQQQYEQTRSDLAPWRQGGSAANAKLLQLLGISTGGATGVGGLSDIASQIRSSFPGWAGKPVSDEELLSNFEQVAPTLTGTDLAGSQLSAGQQGQIGTLLQQIKAARAAPATGSDTSSGFGSLLKPFTGADLQSEPGYQFGLQQGQTALDRRAQAGGSYFSGAALKEAARYGTDYAGTKYGDAFNRDASQKQQTYNFLSGTSSAGQNAANMTSNAGAQAAGTIGTNTTALGNAQGAAGIAGGNALSAGISGAVGNVQQQQLIDAYNQRNALQRAITGGNTGFGTGSSYGNQDLGQYF